MNIIIWPVLDTSTVADAGLLEPEHLLQHQTEAPGKERVVRKLMLDSWNQSIFSNIKQRLQVRRAWKLMLDSWNQSIFSNIKQRLQVRRAWKLMLDSWNQSIFSNIKQRLQVRRAR